MCGYGSYGDANPPHMQDTQPMPSVSQQEQTKARAWNIVALIVAVITIVIELVPVIGTYIALPVSLIAITISGVAMTSSNEATRRDWRSVAALAIALLVLLWSCVKIGAILAGLATGVSVIAGS